MMSHPPPELPARGNPDNPIEFSTAGFFTVDPSVRSALNFNVGWRFHMGEAAGAEARGFDDKHWPVVNLPHGLEILPLSASGSTNYQGPTWYRKTFELDASLQGRCIFLHFEAIMGKSSVWVNGQNVGDFFGGYLPHHINVSDFVEFGKPNQVTVLTDNRDDPHYPPGKPQRLLDFTYFGGIYRNSWLITTHPVHITDPNAAGQVAGGGVFVQTLSLNDKLARLWIQVDLANRTDEPARLEVEVSLETPRGETVAKSCKTLRSEPGSAHVEVELDVNTPRAWHVEDPYLYHLFIRVKADGKVVDLLRKRVGLRTLELNPTKGLILNGTPLDGKLIGGNRHQDFAYLGNAAPNSLQWRDALKMRQAGLRVARCAHYPMSPAFMDACDQLGLLVIVATPGWQFWNEEPEFEQRILSDIANMVRRDRNHPSVLMWEPILNETNYPPAFARKAHDAVHREYPFPGCYTACDAHAQGQEHYDVVYSHPFISSFWSGHFHDNDATWREMAIDYEEIGRPVFTREFGDSVDNWSAQNSPSRVAKEWGEYPQIVQAIHYAKPDYLFTSWDSLHRTPPQHFGGTLWHTFDHQRGYHPDPFWGGILDATRQPKYAFHLFRSQLPVSSKVPYIQNGPMIYIAHEMHPVSMQDVVIFSNCDEVRVSVLGQDLGTHSMRSKGEGMPRPPLILRDAFDHMRLKMMRRSNEHREDAVIRVEGLIDGKVVATRVKPVINRTENLILSLDDAGCPLAADGSDIIAVVAQVADSQGNIKRLNTGGVRFTVSGAAELVDAPGLLINPQPLRWGEAVVLVRATHETGPIRVEARLLSDGGVNPEPAFLDFESVAPDHPLVYSDFPSGSTATARIPHTFEERDEDIEALKQRLRETEKELDAYKLREVEEQQDKFEDGGA